MGFLTGLIEGAATSVDEQLKKDIERSQKRADGMAQYEVTRRRAEVERQEKEKRELRETLGNLASLVDGDVDKAAQLYISGGKNIKGAQSLYEELLKNKQAGVDIKTALTFADEIAEPGTYEDYINKFVTPITVMPTGKGEVKGVGLFGALFDKDFSKEIDAQVEEAAPIPAQRTGTTAVPMATIDRSGFLAAKEASREDIRFEREGEKFAMDIKSAQARLDDADRNYDLALERFNADQENNELKLALDFARDARDARRLDLAVAKAEDEAEDRLLTRDLTKLSIEERQLEIAKLRDAPEFATFEAMLVSADQKLAKALSRPPEMQDANEIKILDRQRIHAIKGLSAIAQAEDTDTGTTTPMFSKQSVDSIINAEIKRMLEPVGLIQDIEGQIEYAIEGNEVQYYDRMFMALDNVEQRTVGINDTQMNNTIKAQRNQLKTDLNNYKRQRLSANDNQADVIETQPIVNPATGNAFGSVLESILHKAYKDRAYETGQIIEYEENGVKKHLIWTGNDIY